MQIKSPPLTGFIQALIITIYIAVFAYVINTLVPMVLVSPDSLIPATTAVLLLVLFSVILCVSLVVAVPMKLKNDKKPLVAKQVFLWTMGWVLVASALVFAYLWYIAAHTTLA